MINLIGTYECKSDAKGRIMLPSALKKQLSPVMQDGFVIKRSVFNNCLEMYSMKEWNTIAAQVNQLNRFIRKNIDFIRSYMSGLKIVEADGNGRILIPKNLIVFAGIDKEIVLTASVNVIEIWDKQQYEDTIKSTLKDFGKLAEEVMGNQSHVKREDDVS
ncbi:MAG: division/cell wall cluster transcriptional repressor MraZ [Flavobacteriales bacterium]|nr:division/cell wall cluster transcriptional repressor MraZ [Flavobacteriales bacterium]MDP7430578.1 division/cell wall cluster transcriptional repressor MraZ [Flavobacteriales bacterium]HJN64248.1 division/cell wall cluster transcriptional repressor MraZ [Flavobacteriales bacterium]